MQTMGQVSELPPAGQQFYDALGSIEIRSFTEAAPPMEQSASPAPVSLEDLAALNREMAALIRAGLPLEGCLADAAGKSSRGAASLAAALDRDLSAGKSLAEAIDGLGDALPEVYRATVAAGAKSGRLAPALEGLADAALRIGHLRRLALEAMVYPLIVVICAWLLFVLMAVKVHPAFDQLELEPFALTSWLRVSPWRAAALAVLAPVIVVAVTIAWWIRSGKLSIRGKRLIPGASRVERLGNQAHLAALLEAMLAAGTPLGEALPVAAEASSLPDVDEAARQLSQHIAAGNPLIRATAALNLLPPLVRVALLSGGSPSSVRAALDRAADTYRRRAEWRLSALAWVLPMAATLGIGGVVVASYALVTLWPYVAMLRDLSTW